MNVLAVINDCRNDLDAAGMGVAAKELAKAHAAIAELLEATSPVLWLQGESSSPDAAAMLRLEQAYLDCTRR